MTERSVGPSSVVVYIVRHGQTVGNVTRKCLAQTEDVLTEHGKLQAKLLGKLLESEKFTKAVTSDYERCVETIKIILEEAKSGITLERDVRLREINVGKYENVGEIKDLLADFASSGQNFLDWAPEGGETREVKTARTRSFFQDLFRYIDEEARENDNILVVSHAAFLFHLWSDLREDTERYQILNWDTSMEKLQRNTGYFKIAIQKNPSPPKPRPIEILVAHGNEHLQALEIDTLDKYTKVDAAAKKFQGCMSQ